MSGTETTDELLSLDELCERVSLTVRTVRFYTSRNLIPSPVRHGRQGFYTRDHIARIELLQDLQGHGFTLSAIEKYMASIPADASPGDIALQRTLLAPWSTELPVELDLAGLEARAGRALSEDDLEILTALGIISRSGTELRASVSQLPVGVELLELGFPHEAALATARIYGEHGRRVADELYDVFRTMVWPAHKAAAAEPDQLIEVLGRLKPVSVASLTAAYEAGMDAAKREGIAKRVG